ncbi:succinate dehydrogenase/fumarate reductase cytochrome b subunit [uncultured Pseudodesulfovibrio sp.]|uniref:succinate dehydrogenase/fumarate reductase cytochrome b subunit n=1 Tax=uncultured Pseudodesulfovibrio sp. TaxID=2035858 RepID=UPI0029C77D40|nr:succinate dehydrogenase/fumarate reductase cytochrome b subunit [uncultured Pseudodesulfovibrio sp.]
MPISYAPAGKTGKWDGAMDWLQMLSGICLILFVWCHAFLESSVIISPELLNTIGHFLEATGMVQVGGPLIFLVFLAHFVLAARKIPFRFEAQASIWHQAKMLRHGDTWTWIVQAASAMIILIMAAIHMWVALSDLPITAAKSAARIQSGGWSIFFLFLLVLTHVHVGAGLYRIGVKWGFVKDTERAVFLKTVTMIVFGFIGLGLITLGRYFFMSVN